MVIHQLIHPLRVQQHGRTVAPAIDIGLDQIDAHALHLLVHHLLQSVAQRDDDDHRSHTDDDAQHGKKGPHFTGPQGLDRQFEILGDIHAPASSPHASGWTTARGSPASPS